MSATLPRGRTRRVRAGAWALGLLLVLTASLLVAPVAATVAVADDVKADARSGDDGSQRGGAAAETGTVELDTTSAQPSETVEAELDATGDVVGAWVRRHERDAADGRVTEHLDEIDEDRIPIAVRIRYELDGEQVGARDLQGASGEAAIRILLRNPTAEPHTVSRPRGGDEVEVDLSLPMVADGLLELDDSWYDVRADVGRLAPARDGATELRWSSALFEPFAQSTAQIEVRGRVEDATLPRLEVDASPVTAQTNDLLRVLERRAIDAGTADAVATFIADNLGEGLSGAAEGADGLAGGLDQARDGAGEIRTGLEQMQQQLGSGFDELEQGLAQLDEGLAGIAQGLQQVEAGLAEVVVGIEGLGEGVGQAQAGAQRLAGQVAAPAEEAVREAWQILGERFTVGRLDPAYVDALMTVGELHALLTGEVPAVDDLDELPGEPGDQEQLGALLAQIAELTGEQPPDGDDGFEDMGEGAEGLEDYPGLAAALEELSVGLGEAADGAEQLAAAVEEITDGLAEIRGGVQEMRGLLDEAAPGAGPGDDADPEEMQEGLSEFEGAMEQLAEGGDELADGLEALGEGGEELIERLERDLGESNLDLATVEALSDRATESVDGAQDAAVGGHERYLLVFHQEQRSRAPVIALTGLAMLGLTLELLRRRLAYT